MTTNVREVIIDDIIRCCLDGHLNAQQVEEIEQRCRNYSEFHQELQQTCTTHPTLQAGWQRWVEILKAQMTIYVANNPWPQQSQRMWRNIQNSLVDRSARITVKFYREGKTAERILPAKAAGEAENVPRQVDVPRWFLANERIFLRLQPDPIQDRYCIELEGGTYLWRKEIEIHLHYHNHPPDILFGRDIAQGGSWTISGDKYRALASIEFRMTAKEQ